MGTDRGLPLEEGGEGSGACDGGRDPRLYVGVGLSHGGLSALSEFLQELAPGCGAVVIVVVPLESDVGEPLLPALSARSALPVADAVDGQWLAPDHVYVAPYGTDLALLDGVIHFSLHATDEARAPLDFLLRSLALDRHGRAVGVILSGSGDDGALGLKFLKEEGGTTFVQEPDTAEARERPLAAIASGAVDFVLPVAEIAREVSRLRPSVHSRGSALEAVEAAVPEGQSFDRVLELLQRSSGVDFTHYKRTTVKRRIRRRMALLRLDSLDDYLAKLLENAAEVSALFEDVLINVTSFFRDTSTFESVRQRVFPEILRRREGSESVRVWVPGCSTGEEAYTLGICFLEACNALGVTAPIQIFASDVDEAALETARTGYYGPGIEGALGEERLRRYFTREEGGYRVTKVLRDMCIFSRQDLTRDPPFSNLDLLSCRNVLIYLSPLLQKKVMSTFHYALKPSGFLVFGGSETIGSAAHLFTLFDKKERIYMKRSAVPSSFEIGRAADFAVPSTLSARGGKTPALPKHDVRLEADRIVLARYAPPGVLVDSNFDIIQFRGQTALFFEPSPGDASFNVMKMIRPALRMKLRSALVEARRNGNPVATEVVRVAIGASLFDVRIDVVPIRFAAGDPNLLVLFEGTELTTVPVEAGESKGAAAGVPVATIDAGEATRLRHELTATQEYLQSIIQSLELANQELQSANEEVVSANEELQSMNEELETAKEELQSTNEELQSTNEELHTVNEELNARNRSLDTINADLNNLIANVPMPIIVVGIDLSIRRFTPAAEKMFNVIPSDVGRSITHIRPNLDVPDLASLISEVIDTLAAKELDVRDGDGRWCTMHVRPSRTVDNKIDGAVIGVVDIQKVKSGQLQLLGALAFERQLFELCPAPMAILGEDLRVKTINQSFARAMGVAASGSEGTTFSELARPLWEDSRVLDLLRRAAQRTSTGFEEASIEVALGSPNASPCILIVQRIVTNDPSWTFVVVTLLPSEIVK